MRGEGGNKEGREGGKKERGGERKEEGGEKEREHQHIQCIHTEYHKQDQYLNLIDF